MNGMEIAWMAGMTTVLIAMLGGSWMFALTVSQRIARVEVVIELMSEKAARILHSPHTPELDVYLERLAKDALAAADIPRFVSLLDAIQNDPNEPKGNRLAAVLTHINVSRRFNLAIPPIDQRMMKME